MRALTTCTIYIGAMFWLTASSTPRLVTGFTQEMPMMISKTVSLKTAKCMAKTIGYNAPEVDICRHSVKTDVYSYGMVFFCFFGQVLALVMRFCCSWCWRHTLIAGHMTLSEMIPYWYNYFMYGIAS